MLSEVSLLDLVCSAAAYVGCFQDPSCRLDSDAPQEMELLADDTLMTPAFCSHLAQVWLR